MMPLRIFSRWSEPEPSWARYCRPKVTSRPAARWVAIWSTTFSADGEVVGFVGEQRDARAVGFGPVDLALELGVQHAQHEVHARLAVFGADRGHVGVDDQDVAGLDDVAEGDVAGVVEEPSQRRDAGEQADLVAGGVEPLGGGAAGELEVVREFGAEELGGLVEVGGVGAGLVDGVAEVGLLGQQQVVDVLELGAPVLLGGERERADDGVVEVAARGLEDLVLVDVQQRGDDVVGDRGRLQRQRVAAGEPQRAHAEQRVAEVQEPDVLAAVGRGEPQAQAAELALGVEHDHGRVVIAHVAQVQAQQGRALTASLAADQQRAVLAVVGVDQAGAVARRAGPAAAGRGGDGGGRAPAARVLRRSPRSSHRAVPAGGRSLRRRFAIRRRRHRLAPVGAQDLGRHRDPGDGDAAHGDALHAGGGKLEQVRGFGGRHEAAGGGQQRRGGGGEAAAVEVVADGHPAAVQAVLAAAGLHGGGELLAGLARVGGDDGLEPEQAAVLGALGAGHLGAVQRRGQAALGQSPAFLADEPVLVAAVEAAGELLEERGRRRELEADNGRRADCDLGVRDRLERGRGELVAAGHERVDEAALLAEAHHVARARGRCPAAAAGPRRAGGRGVRRGRRR